jgi:hypothetical protein
MSLLCLELCTPSEVSIRTVWLTLVAGVSCENRAQVVVGVGVECSLFPHDVGMGGMASCSLVNLVGMHDGGCFARLAGERPLVGLATCCLVNLVGERGGKFAAAISVVFCFLR